MNQHCVTRHEPRTRAQFVLARIDRDHVRCPVHDMYMPTNGCWWHRAGYFQLQTRAEDVVFIANLWVDERYRGCGVGREMLVRIMRAADKEKVRLTLYPDPFDIKRVGMPRKALSEWYARSGFHYTSPRSRYATRHPR